MSDTPNNDEAIAAAERVKVLEEALRGLLIAEKLDDDCQLLIEAREKARQALQETEDKLERLANTQWWDGLEQQIYEAAMEAVQELRALKGG